ncbi:hypothetical protein [Bacteroides neonati]|uniref:hypothetical protein n=1 Tax=Bacteroides neonati TaxID=1347393 RepID=UPI0004B1C207|nr:hypothetical protein [Bacteroides neonati]
MALRNGSTASQLVNDWSGTIAQLNCNVTLSEVVAADNIPTLADIGRSFSNATSVEIITKHLQSVLRYSGVELTDTQLAETALSVLSSYWYLNLAELCIFFCQLKNGSRGQFVWGSKINNQAIMVALSDFCKDRRSEIVRKETAKRNEMINSGFTKIETYGASVSVGIDNIRHLASDAKGSLESFCKLYPELPVRHDAKTWWMAWKGEFESLCKVFNCKSIDDVWDASTQVGMYLCEYNIYCKKRTYAER